MASVRVCGLLLFGLFVGLFGTSSNAQTSPPAAQKTPAALGTIKSINTTLLVLTADNGAEVKVLLPADVKVVRVPPGSKDLKEATPIQLTDLQPGDRVLVRTRLGDDGSSTVATTVIAMKKSDISDKQAKERDEWQRHGIGGLVRSVDAASGAITISTLGAAGPKDVAVHVNKNAVLRRYAPGSVKFDDSKPAPISDVHPGDQLRARGARSADGNEFTADEIVSGSFWNISGTISAVDASGATLTVADIATKKQVEIKVTSDSQMRKLPAMMAQGIAMRLKGNATTPGAGTPGAPGQAGASTPPAGAPPAGARQGGWSGGGGGMGGPPRGGGGDMQQMLSRLPASTLSDFQKGDAVMIVATSGQSGASATVITLLGGVEPILQSSTQAQTASILSPWSLNQGGAGGGDMGTP